MNERMTEFAERLSKGIRQLSDRVPMILEEPRDYPGEAFVLAAFVALLVIVVILITLVVADAVRSSIERSRLGYRRRWDIIGLRVAATLGIVILVLTMLSLVPVIPPAGAACGACHQVAPFVEAWKGDAHAGVSCFGCHARRGITGAMQASADGAVRLLISQESTVALPPLYQERCERCHEEILEGVTRGAIRMRHTDVIEAGMSCLLCHPWVGHEEMEREDLVVSRSQMSVCLTCHDGDVVPAGCTLCHDGRPSDSATTPAGATAQAQVSCAGCHREETSANCIDCHGLELPHPPAFWGQHAGMSYDSPALCARCHENASAEAARPCQCHSNDDNEHGSYNEWFPRHGGAAAQAWPGGCMCHSPAFCGKCHGPSFR